MPCTVIILLLTLEFDSLICYIKGVNQLPMGQKESQEVVFLDIRYIKDEAKGRICLQGQREVGPERGQMQIERKRC